MSDVKLLPPPVEPFPSALLPEHFTGKVDVLRLDKIHPVISGNKWFKLKYNLEEATKKGLSALLSFGGPHSNHLHALAAAGQVFGFRTIGLVRGYAEVPLTHTLKECAEMGMELQFLNKAEYRKRYDESWCRAKAEEHQAFLVPEGGNNQAGLRGISELARMCAGYDSVWVAIGSGCTYSGIASGLSEKTELVGVPVLKGVDELILSLQKKALSENEDLSTRFIRDAHFGGFGKCPEDLVQLIHRADSHGFPLDPVYTAKLAAAFLSSVAVEMAAEAGAETKSTGRSGSSVLLIHTGGLQGRRGIAALSATSV